MSDFTMDVGQTEIATAVTVGEFGMIETHQMEDRGVQIVDVHAPLYRMNSQFVGSPVDIATFDSATRHPHGKARVVMIPPL